MKKLGAWLRQPTTVAGIAALCGTMVGLLTGQIGASEAAPLLTGAIVSIVLPDNTVAKQEAEVAAKDVVAGINKGKGGAA